MSRFLLAVGLGAVVLVFLATAAVSTAPESRPRSNYFAAGTLRADAATDEMYADWYASLLRRMRSPEPPYALSQPSLYEPSRRGPKHPQDYRALISRDREYLMAIHVFTGEHGPEVVANEIDLQANGRNRSVHRRLDGGQWGAIIHQMAQTGMFRGPHHPAQYRGDCLDWVIEEREGAQYNVLSKSCPTDPAFVALADAFLNTVNWKPY